VLLPVITLVVNNRQFSFKTENLSGNGVIIYLLICSLNNLFFSMKQQRPTLKDSRNLIFIILPIVFLYLSLYLKSEMGYYHLFGTDAEYCYLTNGLNLCCLQFPYHVQGPGTPLHVFSAIVMQITYLFRDQGSIIEDVLKNPDVYINVIIITLTILTSILLFMLGTVVGKVTKNILLGLFIQLIPFSSWQTLDLMRRYMLENMIIAAVLLLMIVTFIFIYKNSLDKRSINKYIVLFSIVIGLIAATKLMYLPIAIIPFLVIPGYRNKLRFVLLSMIAFCIMAFAIFHDWATFWNWHVQNFIHSGQYGKGEASIINMHVFTSNFKTVLRTDGLFMNVFILLFAGGLFYHLPFLKVKKENDTQYFALIGIVICMAVMTFLVSKQLKYYYMITAIMLEIPGVLLIIEIFTRPVSKLLKTIIFLSVAIYLGYKCYGEIIANFYAHERNVQRRENYMDAYRFANTELKGQPTLLISDYYGAPYREYGVYFGICWCGPTMAARYAPTLNELYPNVYIHHGWNNLFNQWSHSYSYIDLLKKYKKVVLYVGDENLEKSLDSKLNGLNRRLDVRRELIKSFPKARATFYYVYLDSVKNVQAYTFFFDAEKVDSTRQFFFSREGFPAQNGSTQSDEFAHSGKYSSKLVKDNPYGMTCALSEVQKEDQYQVSVWRYNNGNSKAGLVISGNNPDKYYVFQSNSSVEEKGWQKLEYTLTVPESLVNEDVKIYLWNMDEKTPAYFDDLMIERK
jgi:hypothetical protein